jgi:hypothetical protein
MSAWAVEMGLAWLSQRRTVSGLHALSISMAHSLGRTMAACSNAFHTCFRMWADPFGAGHRWYCVGQTLRAGGLHNIHRHNLILSYLYSRFLPVPFDYGFGMTRLEPESTLPPQI